jgi:ferric-dicitrate binding protein FerR (iron transport regulator)
MKKELILKYLGGDLDEREAENLLEWINLNESNRQYFARIKNEWTASVIGNNPVEIDLKKEFLIFSERISQNKPVSSLPVENSLPSKSKSRSLVFALAAAAIALLIYSTFLSYSLFSDKGKTEYNEITTLRGEKSQITLADGTKIWLNSETTLRYPSTLDSKKVNVYLDGEAYFKVAKKHSRTFIVNTSTINIAVLGTSFNVKSYKSDKTVETTLEEGKISITGKVGDKDIGNPIVLKPNQQATLIKKSSEIVVTKADEKVEENQSEELIHTQEMKQPEIITELKVNDEVEADIYTSWKDGKFIFKSESFESLARRMERWYDIQIIIRDEELKDKKYTGIFEKETVEQALKALSLSLPFNYKVERNKVLITKANNK